MIRVISLVLALGSGALYALNQWAAWLMEHNAAARGFVEAPFFTACAIVGATVVCLATFFAMGIILFPRPTGRRVPEDHEL